MVVKPQFQAGQKVIRILCGCYALTMAYPRQVFPISVPVELREAIDAKEFRQAIEEVQELFDDYISLKYPHYLELNVMKKNRQLILDQALNRIYDLLEYKNKQEFHNIGLSWNFVRTIRGNTELYSVRFLLSIMPNFSPDNRV